MTHYKKIDQYHAETTDQLSEHYREILKLAGEDIKREGILKTPERAAKSIQFLTHGSHINPADILKSALFKEDYKQMVLVKDIEMYSLCEHHMLPFFGKAHIAYIPNGKIVGLSKIPRVVDAFSRRLQVQERLTMQIANELKTILGTESVAVVIDAVHLCVSSRGVQDTNSSTVTAHYSGKFKQEDTKNEFLGLIR